MPLCLLMQQTCAHLPPGAFEIVNHAVTVRVRVHDELLLPVDMQKHPFIMICIFASDVNA